MRLLRHFISALCLLAITSIASAAPNWGQIEALAKQGKLADVQKQIPQMLALAKQLKDNKAWREALLLNASASLGQYGQGQQAAIKALSDHDWPNDQDSQLLLNLHLASFLQGYINNNRWDIRQRDEVTSEADLPLEKQSMAQLSLRMHEAFSKAYRLASQRGETTAQFSKLPLQRLDSYFTDVGFPNKVRGTLRDTVTYLWVDTLKNSSFWTPEQDSQAAKLLTPKLLATPYREQVNPYDTMQHPLKRAVKILSELEQFQRSRRNIDGNLEAFRVKLNAIGMTKASSADKKQIQQALLLRIKQQENAKQNTPWLNKLRLDLAKLIQATDTPDANIRALAALKPCLTNNALPELLVLCQSLEKRIKAPSLSMSVSTTDALNKRSIMLTHKNIETVYFKAWKVKPNDVIGKQSYWLNQVFLKNKLKQNSTPDSAWQSSLAKTSNHKNHTSYITPPLKEEGLWFIVVANTEDFSDKSVESKFVLSSLHNLSQLSADVRVVDQKLEVVTYLGASGKPLANVSVELWPQGSQKPIQRVKSNGQGIAILTAQERRSNSLLLKYNGNTAIVDNVYGYTRNANPQTKSALIFTDRAIYRPSQNVKWKVVAYSGDYEKGKYRIAPAAKGWVRLLDANNKEVQKVLVTTNNFGSASGEFTAKADRLLGGWRIETSWGGNKGVKVEEYKRPTFKASIQKPKQALHLGQAANITGLAEYYFGGAVTDGKVAWSVKRTANYNRYSQFSRYNPTPPRGEAIIANGTTQLDKGGKFSISFKPDATTTSSYESYLISADITDAGGETRTTTRTFNIGKATVKAEINGDDTFVTAGQPFKLTLSRKDLDGNGRAGSGFWSFHLVQQPTAIKMPSEIPVTNIKKAALPFATAGDKLRPRWTGYEGFDRYIEDWRDAAKVTQGSVRHPDTGDVVITLKAPKAGLYRLRYTTKDKSGQVVKQVRNIVASNQQQAVVQLPAYLETSKASVEVGQRVALLAGSGFAKTPSLLEVYHGNTLLKRTLLQGGIKRQNFAVTAAHRGGLTFVLSMLKDHQLIRQEKIVSVPWTDRDLNVSFATFRDKLRPGQKETWRVSVKDAKNRSLEQGAAEVLASMFDRSLELFGTHTYPSVKGLYPTKRTSINRRNSLGVSNAAQYSRPPYDYPKPDPYTTVELNLTGNIFSGALCHAHPANNMTKKVSHCHRGGSSGSHQYGGIGGVARPRAMAAKRMMAPRAPQASPAPAQALSAEADYIGPTGDGGQGLTNGPSNNVPEVDLSNIETRKNFNETAFFKPHLLLEKDGTVTFEFEVPESLTQWKVWVSAITRDLRGGSTTALSRTSKELMVRPYLPRFLRTGDQANIEVLINNASDKALSGKMSFDIIDPATDKTIASTFKLNPQPRAFNVKAGQSTRLRYSVVTPKDLGMVTIRAKASASNGREQFGDGEQRPLPVLPSRVHLAQSRFAALQGNTQRTLQFSELARNNDATRINDRLVITVDGQLFYSTLKALPYLVQYPYECTEQTMNRFLSTGIINQTFTQSPALRTMARSFAKRGTKLEKWDAINKDPNNRILLEETPWLRQAEGGSDDAELLNILNPTIANAQQKSALAKLLKAQNRDGGFPWWDGGNSSIYMTRYLLQSFAKAQEFKIYVPKANVQRAWKYLHDHYITTLKPEIAKKRANVYTLTALSYLLSSYPDNSWTNNVFTAADKKQLLNLAFAEWLKLPQMLKAQLALSMKRAGRHQEAKMIFESVMNSARTDKDAGTYWPTQARSWLWYSDTIDTHAFMLRAMMELAPQDPRRHGLVQWLMLNKKLNHWKSTRATAESIYSLVHYMKKEGQLNQPERMSVKVGNTLQKDFVFKPSEYTGGKQQLVVKDKSITPDMATIKLDNQSKSLMFASATWHFSTEKTPAGAQGDFFGVTRKFFRRVQVNKQWMLQPLAEGATVKVGDQLEVQLLLRSKHNAEYVHLRAPRGAGFEPIETESGYRWQGGTGFYQEIRDSGMNYFFDSLGTGQYTFKYRLRATTSGKFRVAPAQVQSVYAPEFNAYSGGTRLTIQ